MRITLIDHDKKILLVLKPDYKIGESVFYLNIKLQRLKQKFTT